jgi:hypothetical protein
VDALHPDLTGRRAFSVDEFCAAHGISRAMFYKLRRQNNAPRVMRVGTRTLISEEAAADWRRRMEVGSNGAGHERITRTNPPGWQAQQIRTDDVTTHTLFSLRVKLQGRDVCRRCGYPVAIIKPPTGKFGAIRVRGGEKLCHFSEWYDVACSNGCRATKISPGLHQAAPFFEQIAAAGAPRVVQ